MENIIFQGEIGDIQIERINRDVEFNMLSKHFHNQYEIYYLLEGERYYFIDKDTYHVKQGSLVFIDRNQIHKTGATNQTYHDRILILISADELEPFSSMISTINIPSFFAKHFGVLELNENGRRYVENLLFSIMDELQNKLSAYEFTIKAKLMELLIFAVRCRNGETSTFQATTSKTVKHIKVHEIAEYITSNYKDKISLTDISEEFFISKSYLSRIFKEVTGFTVHEYINIVRVRKAQYLLENTTHSITYFEKVFKQYFETSPLKYRKKYKKI
jgi:YesN/AraC family two-component response regulator